MLKNKNFCQNETIHHVRCVEQKKCIDQSVSVDSKCFHGPYLQTWLNIDYNNVWQDLNCTSIVLYTDNLVSSINQNRSKKVTIKQIISGQHNRIW